jgi:hypothetical protein
MQLTLVEDDPAHFDLAFWLDYFKRTRSDSVCLSGGGCVAYYPTDIPFHHRSAWLGDRDVLGELISGCRKLGMSALVRTDPHATYDDVKIAHPDWIAVDVDGKPRRHWSSPEMWVTCCYGPYIFEFMTAVHREIFYSQQTAWYYGEGHADAEVENYALGWYQALVESRIPFDLVHDRLLDPVHLAPNATLILPNLAALSDA